MDVQKTIEIPQVMLLGGEASAMFGPALWAAFDEVRELYRSEDSWFEVPQLWGGSARVRADFTKHYLSTVVPATIDIGVPNADAEELKHFLENARTVRGTYDQRVVAERVHEYVQTAGTLLIVTDLELVPPPEWRYIIWDVVPGGIVLSIAPLDPEYWGASSSADGERLRTVKARARAACASIVGSLLGLSRCDNDRCFLFSTIDSVSRLDDMTEIGAEHGVELLAHRGFDQYESDPTTIANVIVEPRRPA